MSHQDTLAPEPRSITGCLIDEQRYLSQFPVVEQAVMQTNQTDDKPSSTKSVAELMDKRRDQHQKLRQMFGNRRLRHPTEIP